MKDYVAPIDDYRFLLEDVLGFDAMMAELGKEVDTDLATAVLTQAGRFCSTTLHPLNLSGDEEGCRLTKEGVQTPSGFAEAYREFTRGGWASLSADERFGGQGLPFVLQLWFDEMMAATNLSFGLFPGLTASAVKAISAHASQDLKDRYLPPLVSGEWSGAMALTEGGAGTDLALLKTKAVANDDGSFAISGEKIFISSGDHDFGGNIIHLVLARLPDGPSGVKGVSLFLVPKLLPDREGSFSVPNSFSVSFLERKMGIHAQPTCAMNYAGAKGWLIGEPNRGLLAMFTMMNAARLMVGMQGLGIAGSAYQQAVAYARERLQGRGADGERGPVPIIQHADVRRMLLNIRAFVESGRALAGYTALQFDRAQLHSETDERQKAAGFVALLTPVIKAGFTDFGFESAVQAQQIFGGHGYIREWGVEQFVRDARIAQIYEGTNGIQAMDLVGRKISLSDGRVVEDFFELVASDLAEARQIPEAMCIADAVADALDLLRSATTELRGSHPHMIGAVGIEYLRLFSLVSLGWMWARMAAAEGGRNSAHRHKVELANFFAARILPLASGFADIISLGSEPVTKFPVGVF